MLALCKQKEVSAIVNQGRENDTHIYMYGILLLEQLYDNEIFTWNLPLGVSLSDYRSSANHNQSYKVIRFGYKKILVLFDMCLQICNMQAEFELESFTFQQIQWKGILPNLLALIQTTICPLDVFG